MPFRAPVVARAGRGVARLNLDLALLARANFFFIISRSFLFFSF